jgi:hypothetical protein
LGGQRRQLFVALDQKYIKESELNSLLDDADLLGGKIAGLSKSLGRTSRINR